MRKRPNPKLIGGFTLGAAALFALALALFGGGRWFENTRLAVAYFEGSLAGLSEGAPVTFRGVRVGQVDSVALRIEADELQARIPVYLEFQLERVDWVGDQGFSEEQLQRLIERGLRAQLVAQSLVTGQLMVELNFQPKTPVRLVGGADVPEIPTVRSEFDALKSSLAELPLQELVTRATAAMTELNEILSRDTTQDLVPELLQTLEAYRRLADDLRGELDGLSQRVDRTARSADETLQQASRSIRAIEQDTAKTLQALRNATGNVESQVVPLVRELRETNQSAAGAIRQAEATLKSAEQTLDPGSATQRDLRRALEEFAGAARAVRALAEKLERNPNALITGQR
jgi:paraquat-inducible protein B